MVHFDLEKLDNLPYRERFWQAGYYNYWRNNKWAVVCDRILFNNVGKSFDMAFHYLCTKVPPEHRYWFTKRFETRYYGHREYTIEDGIICHNPRRVKRRSKEIIFNSVDFRVEYVYKGIKRTTDEYSRWVFNTKDRDLYQPVVISGFQRIFTSKKDYQFKRLNAEKSDKLRKRRRESPPPIGKRDEDYERDFRRDKEARKAKKRDDKTKRILLYELKRFYNAVNRESRNVQKALQAKKETKKELQLEGQEW